MRERITRLLDWLLFDRCGIDGDDEPVAATPRGGGRKFDGYGGEGDYSWAYGNAWEVIERGHGLRDGKFGSEKSGSDNHRISQCSTL
jgi:hypothetical protein